MAVIHPETRKRMIELVQDAPLERSALPDQITDEQLLAFARIALEEYKGRALENYRHLSDEEAKKHLLKFYLLEYCIADPKLPPLQLKPEEENRVISILFNHLATIFESAS